jgi:hypothetical protein
MAMSLGVIMTPLCSGLCGHQEQSYNLAAPAFFVLDQLAIVLLAGTGGAWS